MIVKNEAPVIERCLSSIKDYIDYWVICDNGSTDGTQKIIKEYLKDIPGELIQHEWVDFSTNRNMAINIAKTKADYLLFIDADDIFIIKDTNVFKNLAKMNYYILINHAELKHQRIQLINKHSDAHYEGILHEGISTNMPIEILNGIEIKILGGGHRHYNPNKFLDDAKLLQKEIDKNPLNARYMFYLAQSYCHAREYQKAIYYYKQRILMGGWIEEIYYSQYQIGCCAEYLQQYEEAILNYLKAYNLRPNRNESFYRLAVLYRQLKKYHLSYLFASKGFELPLTTDILFVDYDIFNYLLLFELSISEYWVGRYKDAIKHCEQLRKIPNVPKNILEQNEKNIQFSLDKIK